MTAQPRAPKLELVDIDSIVPHPENPNEGDVGAICDLIVHNGWFGQTMVQIRDGEPDRIFVGEHRWRALRMLQTQGGVVRDDGTDTPLDYPALQARAAALDLPALPPAGKCWVQRYAVSDRVARRHMLADNEATRKALTDKAQLARLLQECISDGGLPGTAFDEDDLNTMLADLAADAARSNPRASDEAPEPPEVPVTKPGDLIVLGDHRLLCGDSRDPDSFARLLGDERADMVWTDPPYGVEYEGGQNPDSNEKRERLAGDDGTAACTESMPLIAKWSTDAAPLYLWFAGTRGSSSIYAAVEGAGYRVAALIVWHKLNAHYGAFMARYMPKHEPCIYAVRAPAPWFGPTNEVTVWEHDQPARNEYHPTQKPIILAERAIRNSSEVGALVLDPFAGSGTTLMACEQEGRRARVIELDPAYCDVIIERWEQHTGRKAERP